MTNCLPETGSSRHQLSRISETYARRKKSTENALPVLYLIWQGLSTQQQQQIL